MTSGLVRGRCLFLPVHCHGERTVEFVEPANFNDSFATLHIVVLDQVPPPSETRAYAVNLPSPCAQPQSELSKVQSLRVPLPGAAQWCVSEVA